MFNIALFLTISSSFVRSQTILWYRFVFSFSVFLSLSFFLFLIEYFFRLYILIFVTYRTKWLDFSLCNILFLYLHTLQFTRAKNQRAVAMHSEHTRPLSCLHSLFSACHWHRHVRAVERKLFFQLAETPTQICYTTIRACIFTIKIIYLLVCNLEFFFHRRKLMNLLVWNFNT